ncbi:hypothetical protein LCGC14_2658190, partial [marine sediment metagenome]
MANKEIEIIGAKIQKPKDCFE